MREPATYAVKTDQEPFLPYGRQHVDDEDVAAVEAVLRGDWLTTGPAVQAFEQALADRVGASHAVACSSGTAGLHLAMLALGLGPGDAVIVPSITFLATANAARLVGADVVFADVDRHSGLLRVEDLEDALRRANGKRVKAVLPVHLTGQCVDLPELTEAAHQHGLKVVEDACHALGTRYQANGKSFDIGDCAHSDLAVFSFHPVKAIAMGEGGAVTTNDPRLMDRLARLRNHGMSRDAEAFEIEEQALSGDGTPNPWYYEMVEPGLNYRVSDIACALALSQLSKLDAFLQRRAALVKCYEEALRPLAPLVRPNARGAAALVGWHLFAVRIDFAAAGIERAALMRALRQNGIGTQVHYIPVHRQPYYRRIYGHIELPGADAYYAKTLSLPLFPGMSDADVDRVVGALAGVLRQQR